MNAREREGTNTELFSRSALQGRMQCTAGKGYIMADERPVLWRTALQAPECMWFFILQRI